MLPLIAVKFKSFKNLNKIKFNILLRWTYIDVDSGQGEGLSGGLIAWHIAVDLVPVLIPLHRVQGLPVEGVTAAQSGALQAHYVIGYLHLGHCQRAANVCN